MAHQRNRGHQHREDRHGHRDGRKIPVVRAFLGMFVKFADLVRHCSPPLARLRLSRAQENIKVHPQPPSDGYRPFAEFRYNLPVRYFDRSRRDETA